MPKPKINDAAPYFGKYISLVTANSLGESITQYTDALNLFYTNLPDEKANHAYAPGKWTLKELLQHVIDTERIMAYRLLRIARKDKTPLASFDENNFATHSLANNRNFSDIKEEFLALRKSTDLLIQSLNDEQLSSEGVAGNSITTANAIGFIIFGHMLHHKNVIEEKYF